MGALGAGTLGTAAARDFLRGYAERGAAAVVDALDAVRDGSAMGFVDQDGGAVGLVAAEVVAASLDRAEAGLDADTLSLMLAHGDEVRRLPDIAERAIEVVGEVVLSPDRSGLLQLRDGAGTDGLMSEVADLRSRLEAART